MSIEDRLTTAGERFRAATPPAAVDLGKLTRRPASHWLPIVCTAAAVVAAAVVVPTLLIHRTTSATRSAVATPVGRAIEAGDPRSDQPLETDAPPPAGLAPDPTDPTLTACNPGSLVTTAVVRAGGSWATGRITVTAARLACTVNTSGYTLALRGADGAALPVDVRTAIQPAVPNPPRLFNGLLDAGGVSFLLDWPTPYCGPPPTTAVLTGLTSRPLTIPVTASLPPCSTSGSPAGPVTLGLPHRGTVPSAVVPADRSGLSVGLTLPPKVADGGVASYRVELANNTNSPIALRPCPTYGATTGQIPRFGLFGRLPCDQMPDALPPHRAVLIDLPLNVPNGETSGPAEITWGIAGTKPQSASVTVTHEAPAALPDVPWLATPETTPVISGDYQSPTGSFPVLVEGPSTVRTGETLSYTATISNGPGAKPILLRPCGTYTQYFFQPGPSASTPKPLEETRAVNCARTPSSIGPGQSLRFHIRWQVPATTVPGKYQIVWRLYAGIVSQPLDITVSG